MGILVRSLAVLAALTAGMAAAGPPTVSGAWVRATPPGARTAAAYLTISSDGTADTLLGATTSAARAVELHTHVAEGAMARMQRVDAIPVAAGESVQLEPGALHLMLLDIAAPLVPGHEIVLALDFARAGVVAISVPVIDARAADTASPHASH